MKNGSGTIQLSHISPVCLLRTLVRHLWMIVAAALICVMSTSLYLTYLRPPVYRASMTYAVSAKKTSYSSSVNMTAAREVAAVLTELLETSVVVDNIRASSDKLADFDGVIRASQITESNFITVTSEASTPESAFLAISALKELFPSLSEYISDYSVVQVIRNPSVSASPSNAVNTSRLYPMVGGIGAALMALLIAYVAVKRETIQTRTGARELLDAPIIATVCHERKNRTLKTMLRHSNKGLQIFSPTTSFAYTEQINTICAQIEHECVTNGRKIFLITGVGENEGKSTIAANVAVSLAFRNKKVALVDGDLRKPSMHLFFDGKYRAPLPLNKLLAAPFSMDNLSHCMTLHKQLGIYMLFPVAADRRSTELITGSTMVDLLNALRGLDCVIIDSPPMGFFPDAEALADLADASMLVVRQDYTSACDINDAVDSLRHANATFLGCILNDMMTSLPGHYGYGYGYGRYGYGYGYGYGHSEKRGKSHHSSRKNN